jgi:excisionase family DNA binding protein
MKDKRPDQMHALPSIAQVAERCAVSTRTVRRWIDDSDLPISRPGKGPLIRISKIDLAQYINKSRILIIVEYKRHTLNIEGVYRETIIEQNLEIVEKYGFEDEEWPTLARETRDLTRALKAVERPDEMEAGVNSLERGLTAARERLDALLGTVETAPKEPENRPHKYNYKPTPYPKKDTVIAADRCSDEADTPPLPFQAPVQLKRPDKGMVHGISPDELARLAPKTETLSRSAQSGLGRTSLPPPTGYCRAFAYAQCMRFSRCSCCA